MIKKKKIIRRLDRILKIARIDSWPLLINVLKGDLSLIGPKAEQPDMLRYYTKEQKRILSVRPGILGPFQPTDSNAENGGNGSPEGFREHYRTNVLPKKLAIELDYVQDKKLFKDIRLLLFRLRDKVTEFIRLTFFEDAHNRNLLLPVDLMLVMFSYLLSFQLRFDWKVGNSDYQTFFTILPFIILFRITTFYSYGLYRNLWKYIGAKDLLAIIMSSSLGTALIIATTFLLGYTHHSRSIFFIDWMLCILLIGGFRLSLRLFTEKSSFGNSLRRNVLIVGAGDVGELLLRELQKHGDQYRVVGFLDDNKTLHGMSIHGVKVLGSCGDIPEIAPIFRVDEVFITIAKLSSEKIKAISRSCKKAEVRHRIVPAVGDLLNGHVHLSKFRAVEISDMFGREPVELDLSAINSFLSNKRILITGAGGSIGSELCRQIAEYRPELMVLVDKNENYLYEVQCELSTDYSGVNTICSLIDITNESKITCFFKQYHPQIIFHAAAQKHVPLSEENPAEAIINNVQGTKVMADLANRSGLGYFVMVSTDKAVNPANVMGATKRVAELYVQALSRASRTNFVTVRFGNVLNSNGSVIPIFMKQIEKGGPVTITHPDVERYFMSISEAVQLILQAVTMGKSGEIFVLEMGKSIKIVDLAKELIHQAGLRPMKDVPIKFKGLRPGEKLYEELIGRNETSITTSHSSIKTLKSNHSMALKDITEHIKHLCHITQQNDRKVLIRELQNLVPEYEPYVPEPIRTDIPPQPADLEGTRTSFETAGVVTG